MIIEFKTARNINGHREYLRIDTDNKTFTRQPHFIAEGIEIKKADYREMLGKLKESNYKEV